MISVDRIVEKSHSKIVYRPSIFKYSDSDFRDNFEQIISEVIGYCNDNMTSSERTRLLFFAFSTIYASAAIMDIRSPSSKGSNKHNLQAIGKQVVSSLPIVLDYGIMKLSALIAALNLLHQISLALPDKEFDCIIDFTADRYIFNVSNSSSAPSPQKAEFNSSEDFLVHIVDTFCS